MLGRETIDTFNTGESRGKEVSHSLNYTKLGKPLMSMDELAVMNGNKCISYEAFAPFSPTSMILPGIPTTAICRMQTRRTPLTSENFFPAN